MQQQQGRSEGVVHALLKRDRERASFCVTKMTQLLDGSAEVTAMKTRLATIVKNDPVFDKSQLMFMPREQFMTEIWKQKVHAIRRIKELQLNETEARWFLYYVNTESGFSSTHESMFIPTLTNQTNEEQKKKWLTLAKNYQIIGTYAQTELGHGSNVRGLETTAIYDKKTKEFVINSPTLTSTKWWPGGLGKLANHAIVYGRLIVNSTDYGIHGFIVQIRSLEDHSPLPGVTVGDIGPKFGFNSVDNGFLRLNNVRIPRDQMLMGFSSVTEDGVYQKPAHAKIGYGTMLFVRCYIVYEASDFLARACTIAIRYSAIRQQFPPRGSTEKEELPVLDYQTQQYRLLPLLASAFAFHFTGRWMVSLYEKMQKQIQQKDFSLLPVAHASTAGLKAITTAVTADGIEECRKCCGGHGYSHLSGLPGLFASYVPSCTFEGENVILLLQTAQYILKQVQANAFLPEYPPSSTTNDFDFSHSSIVRLYALRAKKLASDATENIYKLTEVKQDENEAWNSMTVELVKMAKAYCFFIVVDNFVAAISQVEDAELKQVLSALCELFSLYYIEKELGDFLEHGLLRLGSDTPRQIHERILRTLHMLRRDAVALVDSWNFPDFLLSSEIGSYDGNAYENLFNRVQNNGLNSSKHDEALRSAFVEIVKPLQRLDAKL